MARPKKNADASAKPTTYRAKLETKLIKLMGQDTLDTILNLNDEELREKLSTLAKHEIESEEALDNNEEVQKLAHDLKEMKAPFKDTITGIKIQRNLIANILQDHGVKKS